MKKRFTKTSRKIIALVLAMLMFGTISVPTIAAEGAPTAKNYIIDNPYEGIDWDKWDDYKTQLQEIIQRNPEEEITYVVTDESGPDHDKSFTVEVLLNSNVIGTGVGKSKKAAEQEAAKQALQLMGEQI